MARTSTGARRSVGTLALLVLLGAVAAVSAAAQRWWTQSHVDSLSGAIVTTAKGSQTDALLIPVALIALAGFGAAVSTTGVIRRSVGAVLLLGGAWAAVLAVLGLFGAPESLRTDLIRPAESSGPNQLHAAGPLLAVLGGVLVATAGVLLLTGFGARRRLGTRYDAPTGRRRRAPVDSARADPANDPEAAASWWKALDAGQDPTAPWPAAVAGPLSTDDQPGAIAPATESAGDGAADLAGQLTARRPPDGPAVSGGVTRDG